MGTKPPTRRNAVEEEDSPFTEDDLARMQEQLKNLDRADRIINRASRGGIDVSTMSQTSRELRDQLTKLKNAFFPGR
jgi:hypothetical protein